MSYECQILADSISVYEDRLTTFQITFPRIILAEINTHRMLSRNSASSRAIPVKKSLEALMLDPFVPTFAKNQPGMTPGAILNDQEVAHNLWISAKAEAETHAAALASIDVHKVWANRLLEPFKWHTSIVTGTDWYNYFALRTAPDAQAEFRRIAVMMEAALAESVPQKLHEGQWHLPLVTEQEKTPDCNYSATHGSWWVNADFSAGRCARVSYLTHDGKRDIRADFDLALKLKESGHMSPFEHQATPFGISDQNLLVDITHKLNTHLYQYSSITQAQWDRVRHGLLYDQNLRGWHSYRSFIPNQENHGA